MFQSKLLHSLSGMDYSDTVSRIQGKLIVGENVVAVSFFFFFSNALLRIISSLTKHVPLFLNRILCKIYEAVLLDGWVKTSRILALVESSCSYGFFVFNVMRNNTGISEVIIDYAFPVNDEFKLKAGKFYEWRRVPLVSKHVTRTLVFPFPVFLQISTKTVSTYLLL